MKEKQLKKWMKHSKLEIKIPDFEENVMDAIQKKEASEKSVWRNIRWSWFFFLVGLILGLMATNLFSNFTFPFLGKNANLLLLVFEILVVVIFATQFDKLIRFTFRK
ncbi:hypothetical protein [Mariniphaga sediminis]|uniref:hypothetical protein n=1 Tax=Mariniphaga sediminis TaxID=1628158 RepID=UPI003561800C